EGVDELFRVVHPAEAKTADPVLIVDHLRENENGLQRVQVACGLEAPEHGAPTADQHVPVELAAASLRVDLGEMHSATAAARTVHGDLRVGLRELLQSRGIDVGLRTSHHNTALGV